MGFRTGSAMYFQKNYKNWFGEGWRRLRVCTRFSWSAQVWGICSWVLDKALPCFGLRNFKSGIWEDRLRLRFCMFFCWSAQGWGICSMGSGKGSAMCFIKEPFKIGLGKIGGGLGFELIFLGALSFGVSFNRIWNRECQVV